MLHSGKGNDELEERKESFKKKLTLLNCDRVYKKWTLILTGEKYNVDLCLYF